MKFKDYSDALRHAVAVGITAVLEYGDLLLADGTVMEFDLGLDCGGYCYGGTPFFTGEIRKPYTWEAKDE